MLWMYLGTFATMSTLKRTELETQTDFRTIHASFVQKAI